MDKRKRTKLPPLDTLRKEAEEAGMTLEQVVNEYLRGIRQGIVLSGHLDVQREA